MISSATFASFFALSILLGLSPGPDNVFVLTQSALRGRKAGLLVTLGLCTGLLVHTALVAFGVAAIFASSALAFTLLKLAGALYLLYLAWGAWHAGDTNLQGDGQSAGLAAFALYRRGIFMNITNPKVSIFFLAFLPQFVDPKLGNLTPQIMSLGGIFMLATLLVFGAVALLAGSLGQWLQGFPSWQKIMNRGAALVFTALAAKLISTQR